MDQYASIRSLPFTALASALGIDLSQFKRDNRNKEWAGPCPIHGSVKNKTCFRYNDDGRYHCFSQGCKGSGGLDLVMAVKKIPFKEAVELLGGISPSAGQSLQQGPKIACSDAVLKPFKGSYDKFKVECEWLT